MWRAPIVIVLALSSSVRGGDYRLLVQDDPASCDAQSRHAPSEKVMTSAEVVAELERTFTVRGHGLSGHFANGRVSFCGAGERQAIDRGLAELGSRQRLLDVVGWRGVVAMLGSAHMVAALDEQLLRKGLAASARKRLSAAREALVQRGAPP